MNELQATGNLSQEEIDETFLLLGLSQETRRQSFLALPRRFAEPQRTELGITRTDNTSLSEGREGEDNA